VILVVVGIDERVDVGDASEIHHGLDATAVTVLPAVDQEGFTVGHDHESRVGLLHVDVVEPQGLRCRERCPYGDQHEGRNSLFMVWKAEGRTHLSERER
jgi:hypothetical protein